MRKRRNLLPALPQTTVVRLVRQELGGRWSDEARIADVLRAYTTVIDRLISDGYRVRVPRLGSFWPSSYVGTKGNVVGTFPVVRFSASRDWTTSLRATESSAPGGSISLPK